MPLQSFRFSEGSGAGAADFLDFHGGLAGGHDDRRRRRERGALEDGQALISLGVLDDSSGTFRVPDSVDLDEYRLVDISFEPVDGDPAHSGDSIVRGELDFA